VARRARVPAGPASAGVTDVTVLGFGPAGASAAIAAHDAGARVTVVEKLPYGGGNCLNSGGFLVDVGGPRAVDHLDALCFGKTPRDVLQAFADGLHEVPAWLASLGGETREIDIPGLTPSWPHFPGAGHVTYRQFVGERPGPALFECLRRAVEARGIEVRYGTTVDALPPGPVVLATGGFEYDAELRDTYLPLPLTAVGHPGNTGDGLRLAQAAGASLWHMSAFFGWFAFRHPDHVAAFPLDVHAPSFIYVDADGRRFADETGWEVHDRLRCLTAYLPRRRNHPHLPGHLILDERARLAGPLNGVVGTPNDYVWSADNSAELEAGWIKPVEQLDLPELDQTLREYGAVPDELGRDPATIVPLEPPLYAIEIHPGVATASGGPRRDARARVLRPDGTPIPGLHAAGGCGSIWGHLTEHGGGLTDAIVFGRIAGEQAAAAP
jgi:succinate dehydrogenase/fumarate reductase flavoprotein subunit